MRNIEIVRGYRAYGHEDVYATDPTVNVLDGDIIGPDGAKITLTDTHLECGIAVQPSNLGTTEYREGSGKTPVYISNFVVRTGRIHAAAYAINDAISVRDGMPCKIDATNTIVWGYVTKVGTDGKIDIRVNY